MSKLQHDYQTTTLSDMAMFISQNEDKIKGAKGMTPSVQDLEILAIHISNMWLNDKQEQQKVVEDPVVNRHEYFMNNIESLAKSYFEEGLNGLPKVDYSKFKPEICEYDYSNGNILTVGDVRYSAYPNETPIFNVGEGGPYTARTINVAYAGSNLEGELELEDMMDENHPIQGIYFE